MPKINDEDLDSEEHKATHELIDPHPCPFQEQVMGNDDNYCQCCELCIARCEENI